MKKTKKLFIALLLVLGLGITGASFAYWAGNIDVSDKNDNLDILVGTGNTIETKIDITSLKNMAGKTLIPKNVTPADDEVTKATFTISILWTDNDLALGANGILSLSINDIDIDTEEDKETEDFIAALSLIDINILDEFEDTLPDLINIKYNVTATFTITVEFSEPLNKLQYEYLAGNNINFTLLASITAI